VTPQEFFTVAAVGGLLSLDAVTVAQVMVSRPIVSSTVVGLLLGAPDGGLIVGAVLEMLAMETMPFGASRYLEWSAGAVVASAFVAGANEVSAPLLLVALLAAVSTAWVAGSSMVLLRRINGALLARRRRQLDAGDSRALVALQGTGVVLDFVRGAVVVSIALFVMLPVGGMLAGQLRGSDRVSAAFVVALPTAVALAAGWRVFASSSRRKILVLAGAILGVAIAAGT
jgi:PTS system mannose-specific IIC component